MMLIKGESGHPRAFNLAHQTMDYSRVRFRKDRDGNVIAFEKCGCEADANTFRPCYMHKEDKQQAVRLKAEAQYHSIQKGPEENQ
jgi:hypothetical protein